MAADLREDAVSTSLAGLPRFKRGVPLVVRRRLVSLIRAAAPEEADLLLAYCRKTTVKTVDALPQWIREL